MYCGCSTIPPFLDARSHRACVAGSITVKEGRRGSRSPSSRRSIRDLRGFRLRPQAEGLRLPVPPSFTCQRTGFGPLRHRAELYLSDMDRRRRRALILAVFVVITPLIHAIRVIHSSEGAAKTLDVEDEFGGQNGEPFSRSLRSFERSRSKGPV